jgi:hypothetical protein
VHPRQLGQRYVGCRVVGQLAPPAVVVDDDGTQPGALDDGRAVAVERDADAQCARAVQELARERYRERELLVAVRRFGRGGQAGFVAVSCPRIAPEGLALLWMFT